MTNRKQVCFCHLGVLFTIQDRITSIWEGWAWGRGVREAAQHIHYVPMEGGKSYRPLITLAISSSPARWNTSKFRIISSRDWPGELLEGAERDHGSHSLTGWSKWCVKQNITHAVHVHHAVVVWVRGEWHPRGLTESNYNENLPCHSTDGEDVSHPPLRSCEKGFERSAFQHYHVWDAVV